MSDQQKFYKGTASQYEQLAEHIMDRFGSEGYTVQTVPIGDDECIVQMKNETTLKTIAGLSEALSVSIKREGDDLRVSVGKARWIDKIGVGLVGTFVLFPFLITAGYGAFKQYKLIENVWTCIDSFLGSTGSQFGASSSGTPAKQSASQNTPKQICPQCSTPNPSKAKFCIECGAPLKITCPSCQTVLAAGAKFCPECGTKIGSINLDK